MHISQGTRQYFSLDGKRVHDAQCFSTFDIRTSHPQSQPDYLTLGDKRRTRRDQPPVESTVYELANEYWYRKCSSQKKKRRMDTKEKFVNEKVQRRTEWYVRRKRRRRKGMEML